MALAFSKTLLCKKGEAEPCNECSSCIKFDSGNHPDFRILSPEKGNIKREEVDKLINSIATAPLESKRKVFVIHDFHVLRLDSQNILLKTLEEPPEYINIILVTSHMNKLLPTILSRCQIIKFYPLESSKIIDLLVKDYSLDKNRARFISSFAKGSIERSIELASSEEFLKKREEIVKIIDCLLEGDKIKALNSMDFFNENKENIEEILDIMIYWFRDLLIYKELGETNILINKDKVETLSKQSFIDLNKINDIIYMIENTKMNIKRNINFNLSIETMLLNI